MKRSSGKVVVLVIFLSYSPVRAIMISFLSTNNLVSSRLSFSAYLNKVIMK